MSYSAPLKDMNFVLQHIADLPGLSKLEGYEEATPDMVQAILEEANKLASGVIAPINAKGDHQHSKLEGDAVRTPDGFKEAYAEYRDNQWNAVPFEPEFGGQGLPWTVAFAVQEMWHSANMAFGLCPLLNQGAVELLQAHGTEAQKKLYLPKLISGEWTGTMNLTESQAGSDLAAVRCKAEPDPALGEGVYRISGQKIFITYGEHDLADNIVHMVLARAPGAPEGIKGISLFLVPKFVPNAQGGLGERNDLRCVSLEGKLGINASPTCTMAFGDQGGAIGYLIGAENQGIKYMFTMMNNARLGVGLEGVSISERAYQLALAYAKDRVQSGHVERPRNGPVRIIEHPDVRRMLLTMKAQTEAARALTYFAISELDRAKRSPDAAEKARAQASVDLLTPVVKSWATDLGCEITSLGVQVHGGMGYVEETGAAQHFRDARIAPIYEGTNGIQAQDLAFRKVARDQGAAASAYLQRARSTVAALESEGSEALLSIKARLQDAVEALDTAVQWVAKTAPENKAAVAASSATFLKMFGIVAGGEVMAKAALAAQAQGATDAFHKSKVQVARFYAEQILPQARGLLFPVTEGHGMINEIDEALF